jgi:proline dehydrogenase
MNKSNATFSRLGLYERAADVLRSLALDENLKARVGRDKTLRPILERISRRYVAGANIDTAISCVSNIIARGHAASAEYMGENCRDAVHANQVTEEFLALIVALDERGLSCSISLDLSHVGLLITSECGWRNIQRIARAAGASGRELMISMEGSGRTEEIIGIYTRLHDSSVGSHVGITLQSRLHRTERDLSRVLEYPGRIRLVKGAYLEAPDIAYPRNSPELREAYLRQAKTLLAAKHLCSIATHDESIQSELVGFIHSRELHRAPFEFETLIGLGEPQIDSLRRKGFATREYVVYGEEHFLYVLNRLAEDPVRVIQAVVDAAELADV